MKIPEDKLIEIRKFAAQIVCNKHLHCLESHLENICDAVFDLDQALLICLEDLAENPCKFALNIDKKTVCGCRIRKMLYEIAHEDENI